MPPRHLRLRCAPAAAPLIVLALALGACGGDGDSTPSKPNRADRTGQVPELQFEVVGSSVEATGPSTIAFPADVSDAVVAATTEYATGAVVAPMATGKATDVAGLFTAGAAAGLDAASPNRVVMVEDGLPKSTAPVEVRMARLTLKALADPFGTLQVVTASMALDVATKNADGPVSVFRLGDLVFLPDNGGWKIAGYDVTVQRDGAGAGPAPTSSTAATTPGAGTP